jgi:hypothetical protein
MGRGAGRTVDPLGWKRLEFRHVIDFGGYHQSLGKRFEKRMGRDRVGVIALGWTGLGASRDW